MHCHFQLEVSCLPGSVLQISTLEACLSDFKDYQLRLLTINLQGSTLTGTQLRSILKSEMTIEGGFLAVHKIKRIGNLNLKQMTVLTTAQKPLCIKKSTVKILSSTIVGYDSIIGVDGSKVRLVGCKVFNGEANGLVASGINTQLTVTASTFLNCFGAGVVIVDGASARLSDCKFLGCQKEGLRVCGRGSNLQASNCKFCGNKYLGVLGCAGAELEFENCLFSESKLLSGAEIHDQSTQATFHNCVFEENCESGLLCHNGAHVKLENCTFVEASCGLDITHRKAVATVMDCRFVDGIRSVRVCKGASCTLNSCHVENSQIAIEIHGKRTTANVNGCHITNFEKVGVCVYNEAVICIKDSVLGASKHSHGLHMSGGHTEVWLTRVTGIDQQVLDIHKEGGRIFF